MPAPTFVSEKPLPEIAPDMVSDVLAAVLTWPFMLSATGAEMVLLVPFRTLIWAAAFALLVGVAPRLMVPLVPWPIE